MYDKTCCKTEECVNLPHFLAVAACKVIIYGNDMNTFSRKSVEIRGHSCNECLTFTCLHLRDSSLMEYDTTHYLNAERTFSKHSPSSFAHRSESFGKDIVKCFSRGQSLLERSCLRCKLRIAHFGKSICKSLYLIYDGLYLFYLLGTVRSENFFK